MAAESHFDDANHYVFEGVGVSGIADTTSLSGRPTGSVTVDGNETSEVVVEHGPLGWTLRAAVDGVPDAYSRSVIIALPQVHTDDGDEAFDGLAIVVTYRTSIGGPGLVKGVLASYDVRTISGVASSVQSLT